MHTKALTLLEIIAVVVIITIIATLGFYFFRDILENSKAKVCETNLRTLKSALDLYMVDHDSAPASLSAIPDQYLQKALRARLQEKGSWKIRLAYFFLQDCSGGGCGIAYAKPFIYTLGRQDIGLITCPKDPTPPDAAGRGISYGLYKGIAKISTRGYQNLPNSTVVIGDSENAEIDGTSAGLEQRHLNFGRGAKYGQGICKDGTIITGESRL